MRVEHWMRPRFLCLLPVLRSSSKGLREGAKCSVHSTHWGQGRHHHRKGGPTHSRPPASPPRVSALRQGVGPPRSFTAKHLHTWTAREPSHPASQPQLCCLPAGVLGVGSTLPGLSYSSLKRASDSTHLLFGRMQCSAMLAKPFAWAWLVVDTPSTGASTTASSQ